MRRRASSCGAVAAILWLWAPVPLPAAEPAERVVDGLEALYTFEADVNGTIPDRSGVQPPIDLRIDRPQAVRFRAGCMAVSVPVSIASDGPATRITTRLRQAQQFSIEAWVTPAEPEQTGPARIVTLSLDAGTSWGYRRSLESDPEGWYCYTAIEATPEAILLAYCAGDATVGKLNRLRIRRLPTGSWSLPPASENGQPRDRGR